MSSPFEQIAGYSALKSAFYEYAGALCKPDIAAREKARKKLSGLGATYDGFMETLQLTENKTLLEIFLKTTLYLSLRAFFSV